jgi:hypothetical protein
MYFLLGGLSSCFILLGTSLLYANSGTTNLDNIYIITSISEIFQDNTSNILSWYKPYYIESVQAFIFYIIQYSISNLNAFILTTTIGYTSIYFLYYTIFNIKFKCFHINYYNRLYIAYTLLQ